MKLNRSGASAPPPYYRRMKPRGSRRHAGARSGNHADDHTIDRLVSTRVDVGRLDRDVRRLEAGMLGRMRGKNKRERAAWIRYEDRRLQQRVLRQEAYFDLGWELGERAATIAAAARAGVAAQLLELTRTLIMGLDLGRRSVKAGRSAGQRWQAEQK
jgi:hypothetical protein